MAGIMGIDVDVLDIMNVIADFKRRLVVGQSLFNANLVIMCGVASISERYVQVCSRDRAFKQVT